MIDMKGSSAARIYPFAFYILFLALDQPLSRLTATVGFDARWLYAVRVGLVAVLLAWLWRSYSELKWPIVISWRAWLVAIASGSAVFALWILPYPDWAAMGAGGKGFDPTGADGGIDPVLAACRIAGAALVVPLMEELFWRSYLMRWLEKADFLAVDPSQVRWVAFVATAALFAVEHHFWLAGLLAGMTYGWLYLTHRNLWVPVIAHAITNAMLGVWVLHTGAWQYW